MPLLEKRRQLPFHSALSFRAPSPKAQERGTLRSDWITTNLSRIFRTTSVGAASFAWVLQRTESGGIAYRFCGKSWSRMKPLDRQNRQPHEDYKHGELGHGKGRFFLSRRSCLQGRDFLKRLDH